MTDNGNAAQTRALAKTLFDTWKAEQDLAQKPSRVGGSIPAWIACGLSIATLIWGAAVISSDVSENRRRIESLEVGQLQQARDDQASRDRLARIEAKIDVLMGEK
jgi:hypothetical protein